MDWVLVGLAGLLGGMLNAVAGGGSFITLPALIVVGVPPVTANATGTAALLPGYIASAWRFRRDIAFPAGLGVGAVLSLAALGGCLGAAILLVSGERLFARLIPWLILFATAAFVVGPWLLQRKTAVQGRDVAPGPDAPGGDEKNSGFTGARQRSLPGAAGLFAVCTYGGYFNGGLGILLLAVLGLMGQTNLHGMNGLKSVVSALLTSIAVVVYLAGGVIAGGYLLLLGTMAVLGGYLGAALAYRVPQQVLRGFIVGVGLAMSAGFFYFGA
ncbi:MAG TPA: sulfite exporter TauE/SafE family protein [Spongiibacteraceae bacterium]|jgi:uncharacterized membrane protein YfcA|nr:sulfite exporter TauE/SafE family protein [Spongiibacteraceae bacterium]HUH37164.1 sulfite exporter TauE/SafE family protein [Spongiibacteraceae bacterium]